MLNVEPRARANSAAKRTRWKAKSRPIRDPPLYAILLLVALTPNPRCALHGLGFFLPARFNREITMLASLSSCGSQQPKPRLWMRAIPWSRVGPLGVETAAKRGTIFRWYSLKVSFVARVWCLGWFCDNGMENRVFQLVGLVNVLDSSGEMQFPVIVSRFGSLQGEWVSK